MIYITIYESEHCLHECCEKHCPICQELSVIDSVLKQTLLVLPLLISFLIAILYQEWHSPISFSDLWKRTLILDKVRIDD